MNLPDLYLVLAGAVGSTVVLRGASAPMKLASVHRAGTSIVLAGRTLDGRSASCAVRSRGDSPLTPAWAVRLGSMLRLAWDAEDSPDWDTIIKDLIAQAGLPVDHEVRWGPILYNIFTGDKGLGRGDSEFRDELIQEALVRIVLRRSLEKFDPDAVENPDPNYANLPMKDKVRIWMIQLLKGLAGSREVGGYARKLKDPRNTSLDQPNPSFGEDEGGEADQSITPAAPEIMQDSVDDKRSLQQLRSAFETWVQNRRGGQQPRKMLLMFDLLTREPSMGEAIKAWKDATNTGYQTFNATIKLLRTAMAEFANSDRMRNDLGLVRLVNDLRLKSLAAPPEESIEPLQADPDLIPAEPAPVENPAAGVGPKAQVMKSSALVEPPSKIACFNVYRPKTARPQGSTQEEPPMPTLKFATLQRLAAEAPEEVSAKVESIKQHLLDQVTLLENFQEQLDMSPEGAEKFDEPEPDGDADDKPGFKGTKEEGEKKDKPEEKKEDDKQDGKFAGLRHFAAEEPEAIEDAIQDFFLGLDQVMAETESLADTLGVELVAPEVTDDPDNPDAGLHGEQPGSGGDLVEFSGTADPDTAKVMFDAGAAASNAVEEEEEEDPDKEFTLPG